jgi:hypothetical protein
MMTIHQAIDRILGEPLATAIANDQGLHWAVIAAMADCKVSHGPEVKQAIDDYLADLKREVA